MSLAALGGSVAEGAGSRAGITVGASAILPLATSMGLELGAGYAAKSATEEELGVEVDLALGCVEVPLLPRSTPSIAMTSSTT